MLKSHYTTAKPPNEWRTYPKQHKTTQSSTELSISNDNLIQTTKRRHRSCNIGSCGIECLKFYETTKKRKQKRKATQHTRRIEHVFIIIWLFHFDTEILMFTDCLEMFLWTIVIHTRSSTVMMDSFYWIEKDKNETGTERERDGRRLKNLI